jgi:hypothetical protein
MDRKVQPQSRPHHPPSWEASLWGRRVRCHDLDRHVYLDGRFLDLTPIEFCLFRLLLQQALEALQGLEAPVASDSAGSRPRRTLPRRYLQQVGIVPTGVLLRAMTSDPSSFATMFQSEAGSRPEAAGRLTRLPDSSRSRRPSSSAFRTSSGRACLASHLDRLRGKLRCHGLDVGTILLFGRSAQGHLLLPQDDLYEEG